MAEVPAMKQVTVTIRDVAKAAEVSPKTISRVLNNERWVQPETRERVLRVIKELDYRPNPLARGLNTDQMPILGVVLPDLSNPFFSKAMDGCAEEAERQGYGLSLATARYDPNREARHIQDFLAQRVSGLILWAVSLDAVTLQQSLDRFKRSCPVVLVNSPSGDVPLARGPYSSIAISEERIGALATQHLLNEGRQRTAFLGVQSATHWITQQRLVGYQSTLWANGIQPRDEWLHYAHRATIREGFIATSTILSQLAQPDSIFAVNDLLAVGALLACREAGLRVPEDIAVVGVDDTDIAIVAQPPLTSIRLHQRAIGQQAVNLVLSMIRPATSGLLPIPTLPIPDLVVRRSSTLRAAPAASHEDIDALE